MPHKDFFYFQKLKEELVRKVKEQNPDIEPDISKWKGQEIHFFQQDLERTVNGRISEKWFYTHLKSETSKLPRVDILDLLSKYVGFENWQKFKSTKPIPSNGLRGAKWILVIVVGLLIGGYVLIHFLKAGDYSVIIVDAYTNRQINRQDISVTQLFEDQSPMEIVPDETGVYSLLIQNSKVTFSIAAPYYHTDTIHRKSNGLKKHEVIRLFPNDYALMLHYFSQTDTDDWMKRRAQLSEIICDNARIFQVDEGNQMTLEMYTKHSFINKLTIPSKSLRNIEILDIRFQGDQISHLRFMQKGGKNE